MNFRIVDFKGINDAYFVGVEYEKMLDNGPLQRKVKKLIKIANLQCRLGIKDYGLLSTIIFKQEPSEELLRRLAKEGYKITYLPDNPYISGGQ